MMKSVARKWIYYCVLAAVVVPWPMSARASGDETPKFAVAKKESVPVMVIDSVAMPTEN